MFDRYLLGVSGPPALMFYGVGSSGKTWLLKNLRQRIPPEIPSAFLDLSAESGGQRFVLDPPAALFEIRQQLGYPTPRFDLGFGIMRH